IPSKALLHSSERYAEARHGLAAHGIKLGKVELDLPALMARKDKVVADLTKGIEFLLRKNKVDFRIGRGSIPAPGQVKVAGTDGSSETLATRAIVIATGSEVALALAAQKLLAQDGVPVRAVSMPSTTTFDRQDAAYRDAVLPRGLPRVAVEAGVTDYWRKYVGLEGAVIGIDRFGESAPGGELFRHFGFTPEKVAAAVKSVL
ncbi:MAG: transketolase-like TK C-terminal-containing protein, partial [Burkholderiales bacterium]